jgi:hypothetical protein
LGFRCKYGVLRRGFARKMRGIYFLSEFYCKMGIVFDPSITGLLILSIGMGIGDIR